MKLAFVGPAGTTPARLEELLVCLVERRNVAYIVPVGAASGEIAAVLRGRERRFPVEVAYTAPEYPDFVLAAVLEGVGAHPGGPEERARTTRLMNAVRRIGKGPAHIEELGPYQIAVALDEQQASSEVHLVVVPAPGPGLDRPSTGSGRSRLRPAGLTSDGRLVCAEVELVDGGLEVRFVDGSGETLRAERL
ncbi:MAG: hypothetical protein EXR76_00805 [Myxococcales bacterium]|nr:hypothetical protein [Myxococcales bacterium]